MSRKTEIKILVALLAVLAVALYWNFRPDVMAGPDVPDEVAVEPLRVPDPALHLDRLAELRGMSYSGAHRNIFSAEAAPVRARAAKIAREKKPAAAVPAPAAGPAPLEVPLTFYGMAVDPKTGKKLGFFTSGDTVYVASEGQTLLGRFRLVKIGNNRAEFEELSSGRTAVLTMTAPVSE